MPKNDFSVHPDVTPRIMTWEGIAVREDVLCANKKGVEKAGIRKATQDVVRRLRAPLQAVLEPGEAVLCVARGQAPLNALQQLSLGWWAQLLTATTLVITNQRVLQFGTTRNGNWARTMRAVRWSDIEQAPIKGWLTSTFELKCRNGKNEKFWGMRRSDTGILRVVVSALQARLAGEAPTPGGMVSLCPECRNALQPRVYQCASCGLVFKNESTLIKLGILVPGGAYFYTGHPLLGAVTALGELYLLLLIVAVIFTGIMQPTAIEDPSGFWVAAAFFIFAYALETAITIGHNLRLVRDFLPTGKRAPALGAAAAAMSSGSSSSAWNSPRK